ncbi:MAG: glycosyltransferase, partial [Planctomycetota bacterium]
MTPQPSPASAPSVVSEATELLRYYPDVDTPRSRRVLHVINGEHFAGAERVQDLLALRLPDHGFDVGFVALKAGRFGDVRESINTPLAEVSMASRWDLRSVRFVTRMLRDGDYHLLHAHTPRSALIASLASRATGVPMLYHVHSPTSRDSTHRIRNWVNDRVERFAIRSAAKLITVSPTLTEHMHSLGVAPERMQCVLNGVPAIAGAQPRCQPTDAWTVGMVALFRPRKGAEVLIESLAALRARGHNLRLRMIGSFESEAYEQQLIGLARRLEVLDAIDWTGFTNDVASELAKIDLLALPSLFGEGLPMVVLEAMAAALPVVATHCEGVSQAVLDGKTGRLVEPGSVGGMAAAIEEIVTGAYSYEQLSHAALNRHAEAFSDDTMARQ